MISDQKIRIKESSVVRDIILFGCTIHSCYADDPSMPRCGKDVIVLEYTNGGYGDPRWNGYCIDHLKEREIL